MDYIPPQSSPNPLAVSLRLARPLALQSVGHLHHQIAMTQLLASCSVCRDLVLIGRYYTRP